MTSRVRSLNHIGVVVEDIDAATEFFVDLGLELQGKSVVGGPLVGGIVGLENPESDIVFLRAADGGTALELTKFRTHPDEQGPRAEPPNRLGLRHLAFEVEGLHGILAELRAKGFETVGTVEDYEGVYRLCYVRGPEGIIVELAEEIGAGSASTSNA